jgi:phosphocarrier protein
MAETALVVNRPAPRARRRRTTASGLRATTLVTAEGEIDAKSILGILLLAAGQGTELTLRCTGADEAEAARAIVALFADRFGEGE